MRGMPLPASLLAAAAQHPCFSGVFDAGNRVQVHVDPAAGPIDAVDFQCEDCLTFRLGCLVSDLPKGVSQGQAARLVTEHVRRCRGYAISVGGYHTSLSGWLSAVYWDAAGIFALHSDRSGSSGSKPALDVLIQAMHKGLIKPAQPAMLDPQQYVTHDVFLSVVPPPSVTTMAALLASGHVATGWKSGYCRVTLAEFLPVSRAQPQPAASPAAASSPPSPAAPGPRVEGQPCQVCGEIVGERWLLTSRYVGCRCG
jgi:hypothetical protein